MMAPELIVTRVVRTVFAAVVVVASSCGRSSPSPTPSGGNDASLVVTTLAGGFDTIWELAWGPDGVIWITERGGAISRVNPSTGAVSRAGTVPVNESGEGGLLGLAFHPDFATSPYIYVVHTYSSGFSTRNRLVRLRWDGQSLGAPEVILDGMAGSSIHNGSRVVVGPDRLLYVTMGDASNDVTAQDRSSLNGKILRLTLDGAPAPGNPFGTRIYTFGHRNPQGLVFSPAGLLYSTEHGPADNDELNLIEAGRNYGWPNVHGRCDGDVGPNEQAFCQANNVVEPMANWTPTIAPSGLDYYDGTLIPGWRGSLLFTTLKGNALYRMQLAVDGRRVVSQEKLFEGRFGRLRDVLAAPDGSIYVATSNRDGRGSPEPQDDRILHIRP